jgi:preprotein translocase subunit SecF
MNVSERPRVGHPDEQRANNSGRHTFADLYHERTHFQFINRSWRWAILSGTLILISVVAFGVKGLNLGIDFQGGTQWQFTVNSKSGASISAVRTVLDPLGLKDAKVLIVGNNSARVQSEDLSAAAQDKITAALAKYAHVDNAQVSVTNVGPTWGDKVSSKALTALTVFFFVIAGYLTFRFEWRMALAAIIAVLHDIIITVGVYAVTGFEVTPATVVAFLTILGFSLYDTVVVFDKVKDNQARLGTVRGDTYSLMVNRSLNQVLMRSINTSIVALLPVASLLFVGTYVFGGLALRDFALALFVGLLTGAYSSIFVATPILAWLKEREPKYRSLRERAAADLARGERATAPVPAGVAAPPRAAVAGVDPGVEPGPESDTDAGADTDAGTGTGTGTGTDGGTQPPAQSPAPAPAASPSYGATSVGSATPTRGAANPKPRQQRGRKRK